MRVSNGMRPVHPGEILAEELEELGLSANALANALCVPTNRITAILKGQRGVTADTALRLSRYFGTTPQLWLNLQKTFELRVAEIESGKDIADRVQPREPVQVSGAAESSHGGVDPGFSGLRQLFESLLSLRYRPSQAKVRSTTQRRGSTWKVCCCVGRRRLQPPASLAHCASFAGPEEPLAARG